MFGIGMSELLVIACVAIVFIRPKDLPAVFRRLGKMYARAKKVYNEIVSVKDKLVRDLENAGGAGAPAAATPAAATPDAATPDGADNLGADTLGDSPGE